MKKIWLLLSLLIILASTAVAQPSQNSSIEDPGLLPGDLFYPVENFAEGLEVKIAGLLGGDDFQAKALANNAEESLTRADILAERNNSEQASEMAENYFKRMSNSKKLAENSGNSNLSRKIDDISRKNVDRLEKIKQKVPEEARKGIENAIEKSKGPNMREKVPGKENNQRFSKQEIGNKSGKDIENTGEKSVNKSKDIIRENREKASETDDSVDNRAISGNTFNEHESLDQSSEVSGDGSSDENLLDGNGQGLR